jgi:glycosyltransferase involved in cell wall biosynthesis
MTPRIQIYGQFDNFWSNANVSRGLACGLAENGVEVCITDTSDGSPFEARTYQGLWKEIVVKQRPDPSIPALFVGYPPQAMRWLEPHKKRIGAFIAESSLLPESWGVTANYCDIVAVPSMWVFRAYRKAGVPVEKLLVVQHGIDPVFSVPPPSRVVKVEHLHFLHIAGARDFLVRKGTPQLISAFTKLFGEGGQLAHKKATLTIRTPPSPPLYRLIGASGAPHLFLVDAHEGALPPEKMYSYYLGSWAALVQPSRAEAFGICPVEARALGIPVILTEASGHREHFTDSADTRVYTPAGEELIAVQGIPSGLAPAVSEYAIEEALVRFCANVPSATRKAAVLVGDVYTERWSWKCVTAPLAKALLDL